MISVYRSLGEKRKLRAARGSGITATTRAATRGGYAEVALSLQPRAQRAYCVIVSTWLGELQSDEHLFKIENSPQRKATRCYSVRETREREGLWSDQSAARVNCQTSMKPAFRSH